MKVKSLIALMACVSAIFSLQAMSPMDDDFADEQGEVVQYDGEQYIRVSNAKQLLRSFISGKNILVASHTEINLTPLLENEKWWKNNYAYFLRVPVCDYESLIGQKIVNSEVPDGRQLDIVGFHDIKIAGEEDCNIVVEPRYAFCLNFVNCKNITLSNLTIGHTEDGNCMGGVIGVKGCNEFSIEDCNLYGCGTYGVQVNSTIDFSMTNSCIHDCTYGIMTLNNVEPAVFEKCSFFNNRQYELVKGRDSDISFIDCRFYYNNPSSTLFDIDREFGLRNSFIFHPTESLGHIERARQEGNTFNPNPEIANLIGAEEVKVNFKGAKPNIVDLINSAIGDGYFEENECDNWIRMWNMYLRTQKSGEYTYIVDKRNGYVRIESKNDDGNVVVFNEFCFWNCADGKHKLMAASNGVLDHGKAVETECTGLTFYLYDNATQMIKYVGMEEELCGSRPSASNDITYLLPRTGKDIVWVDGEGKRGTLYWNGSKFLKTKPKK